MLKFTNNSTQAAKIISEDYTQIRPYDHYGRRRLHYFDYVVPAGDLAVAQVIAAMKIPDGARIVAGQLVTSGEATVTLDVGLAAFDGSGFIDAANTVADDDDFLAAALDVGAAGADPFASTLAQNYGYITEKALWVTLTIGGAQLTAGAILKGEIEIVVD